VEQAMVFQWPVVLTFEIELERFWLAGFAAEWGRRFRLPTKPSGSSAWTTSGQFPIEMAARLAGSPPAWRKFRLLKYLPGR